MSECFLKRIIKVGGGTNVSDTTAIASDVLASEDFYLANGTKTTGTIETYSGDTEITENATLETEGKYLASDLVVNVPSGTDTSDATAEANDVRTGETFYSTAGTKLTGTIANYTPSGTITSNQTLGTANKYCTSDIVIDIPQPELVNIVCGKFNDPDLALYLAGNDIYFTTPTTKSFKLLTGSTIIFNNAESMTIYENGALLASTWDYKLIYPILFSITIAISNHGIVNITHSSTEPTISMFSTTDLNNYRFYYNIINDSIDYTDGSWVELKFTNYWGQNYKAGGSAGLFGISQIKFCAVRQNLGNGYIGITLNGNEIINTNLEVQYTSIQQITEHKNYFFSDEAD